MNVIYLLTAPKRVIFTHRNFNQAAKPRKSRPLFVIRGGVVIRGGGLSQRRNCSQTVVD